MYLYKKGPVSLHLTTKFISIQRQEKQTITVYINDLLGSDNREIQIQVGNSENEGR
jgi:hypothetical protein